MRNLLLARVSRIDTLEVRCESERRLAIPGAAVPRGGRGRCQGGEHLEERFRIPRASCGVLLRDLGERIEKGRQAVLGTRLPATSHSRNAL